MEGERKRQGVDNREIDREGKEREKENERGDASTEVDVRGFHRKTKESCKCFGQRGHGMENDNYPRGFMSLASANK